jgi:hypothetical protein
LTLILRRTLQLRRRSQKQSVVGPLYQGYGSVDTRAAL